MKNSILAFFAAFLCLATPAVAELEGKDFFNKDTRIVGVNVLFDVDAELEENFGLGFEGLFATPWQDLDEVGLLVGHRDNNNVDATHVMFYASDQYDLTRPVNEYYETPGYLFAYATLGIGYMWTDIDDASDLSSLLFRAEAGIKLFPFRSIAVVGGIRHDWSDEEVFSDEDGDLNDKNWEFVAGVRFHY